MKLILCLFLLSTAAIAQNTVVTASSIQNGSGAALTGKWCLGSTCFNVISGAIAGNSQVPNPSNGFTVTVLNGSQTVLTVPNVSISGSTFNWDNYVVPAGTATSGIGTPYIHCAPTATYVNTAGSGYTCNSANAWTQPSGGAGVTIGTTHISDGGTSLVLAGLTSLNGLPFAIYNANTYNVGGAIPSNTQALSSTATGYEALAADVAGSETGVNDTAYGYGAMGVYTGTNGSGQNSAFGTNALGATINGVGNQVYGEGGLAKMQYGTANDVMGYEALLNWGEPLSGTTTNNGGNIAIGYAAANNCPGCDAGFTSGDFNVYIGNYIEPAATGDTKEIVIAGSTGAAGGLGRGSYTTTVGDAATTSFLPFGTISVAGPTAPTVVSNAGTGALTNGTDNAGIIATGTASTATTLTFAVGWSTWASCTVSASTSTALPYVSAISKTAATFTYVTTGTPNLYYVCLGA